MKYNGTDWAEGGFAPEEAVLLARALVEEGVDMVTLSGGGVVGHARPPVAPGYQIEAARRVKGQGLGLTVGAVGMIFEPRFAESIIAEGSADTVALARAMLFDPRWPYHAAVALGAELTYPPQYARAAPAAWSPAATLFRFGGLSPEGGTPSG